MNTRGTLPIISSTFKKQLATACVCVAATALILLFIARQKWPSPTTRFAPAASKDIKRQLASGEHLSLNLPATGIDSIEIRPERLPPANMSSDIYLSLLTAPIYHNSRFALQYLTWLQTVDLKHVRVVTDNEDNKWIKAFKSEGGTVVVSKCPISKHGKSREMMCCKSGIQYDYWYKARGEGKKYKWYCHIDDDLYLNIQTLVETLSHYNPSNDCYLGNWKVLEKVHKHDRIPAHLLAPKLLEYTERKRDDFRYASGPSFCISEALMMKVEKYMRGRNFEAHCRKSEAAMDDLLPGVVIDAILGIDMNETLAFKGQLDDIMYYRRNNPEELKRLKREVTVGFTRLVIKHGTFNYLEDPYGIFSYHCLLHPGVSWCNQRQPQATLN